MPSIPSPPITSGLVARFDARAMNGTDDTGNPSDGGSVTNWLDMAGGLTATQGTSGKRPVWRASGVGAMPAVDFDGSDDYLAVASFTRAQPFTVYLLAQFDDTLATQVVLGNTASVAVGRVVSNDVLSASFTVAFGALTLDTAPHALSAVANGGSSVVKIDGQAATTASGGPGDWSAANIILGSFDTGTGVNFDGKLAVALIYSGAHDSTDRATMEAYLLSLVTNITATAVSAVATVGTPALPAADEPDTVTATASVGSPTVTTGQATATPATVSATASVGSPTPQAGSTVSPATVSAVAAVPAPSLTKIQVIGSTINAGFSPLFVLGSTSGTDLGATLPADTAAGDLVVVFLGAKWASYDAAQAMGIICPSGRGTYTEVSNSRLHAPSGIAPVADVGAVQSMAFTKEVVAAELGSSNFRMGVYMTQASPAVSVYSMSAVVLRKSTTGDWVCVGSAGEDAAGGVGYGATGVTAIAFAPHDVVLAQGVIPTDVTTPTQFSSPVFTASGVTFGAASEVGELDTSIGNDMGGVIAYAPVSGASASATSAPTFAATAGGTTTNVYGPISFVRARLTPDVTITPSTVQATASVPSPVVNAPVISAVSATATVPTATFVTGPANDDWQNAITLAGSSGTEDVDLTNASPDPDFDYTQPLGDTQDTVWYKFTVSGTNKQFTVSVSGLTYPMLLEVFPTEDDEPSAPALQSAAGTTTSVELNVADEAEYYVRVSPVNAGEELASFDLDWAIEDRDTTGGGIPTGDLDLLWLLNTSSLTRGSIDYTPGALLLNIAGGEDGGIATFTIEGDDVGTVDLDGGGAVEAATVPIPLLAAGTYALTVTSDTATGTIDFEVLYTTGTDTEPDDTTPAPAEQTGVQKWSLLDPLAELDEFLFPYNPSDSGNPFPARPFTGEPTTSPTGNFLEWEGTQLPNEWTVAGYGDTEEFFNTLVTWSLLNRRVWVVDHHEWVYVVTVENFAPTLRRTLTEPWSFDYQLTFKVYSGPEELS